MGPKGEDMSKKPVRSPFPHAPAGNIEGYGKMWSRFCSQVIQKCILINGSPGKAKCNYSVYQLYDDRDKQNHKSQKRCFSAIFDFAFL